MKTEGVELLKVDPTPVDDAGNKLEPEERTATEVISMPVDVTLADHAVRPGDLTPHGQMRGKMATETTAGDVAMSTATRCELCEHWRQDDYKRHLASIEDTKEGAAQIERLRGELLGLAKDQTGTISDEDFIRVNLAVKREFGICAVFTETTGLVTISPYYGGCPLEDQRFKMRDREARTIASAGYDKILRMAQGRME